VVHHIEDLKVLRQNINNLFALQRHCFEVQPQFLQKDGIIRIGYSNEKGEYKLYEFEGISKNEGKKFMEIYGLFIQKQVIFDN